MTSRPKIRIPATIAAEIGAKIVSGRLLPGTVLGGEIEASAERNVSRSAYREAIRILVAKGLVESRPKIGTRITNIGQWHLLDPDVLSWIFAEEPPQDLLVALFELRKMVEPEAAALAAQRRSKRQLDDMREMLRIMDRETLHTDRGRQADHDFHATLLLASSNPFLSSLSTGVTAAITWSTAFKDRTQRIRDDSVADHERVYDAIAACDPDGARQTMARLIDLAFEDAIQRTTPQKSHCVINPANQVIRRQVIAAED
jgi:DNA-binding FadR family transcriptional regulator